MKAQINFWNNEHEWTSYYDDEPYTVKNFNYNYNFHDAEWNNLANSGGNERFIVDPDDGSLMLDEQGSHVGFNLRIEDADPDTWASYDPGNVEIFGTDDRPVAWSDIAEIDIRRTAGHPSRMSSVRKRTTGQTKYANPVFRNCRGPGLDTLCWRDGRARWVRRVS